MMNLIRARAPSLIIFGTIQVAMWSFVYSQWHQPNMVRTPLKSAIPAGHIGQRRYQHMHAHALA
ncbi:hypothetical protein K474DRAFT_1710987 [Panus rudis PR-1116 ss-1]|nr:hypothetical protein K474DRAFT_1710987 [Panus rudis PR-1116 ss-1]